MQTDDEQPAELSRGDSALDDDLLEMEAFVSQIPAADGNDVAAAPKLPPARKRKRKMITGFRSSSSTGSGGAVESPALVLPKASVMCVIANTFVRK